MGNDKFHDQVEKKMKRMTKMSYPKAQYPRELVDYEGTFRGHTITVVEASSGRYKVFVDGYDVGSGFFSSVSQAKDRGYDIIQYDPAFQE